MQTSFGLIDLGFGLGFGLGLFLVVIFFFGCFSRVGRGMGWLRFDAILFVEGTELETHADHPVGRFLSEVADLFAVEGHALHLGGVEDLGEQVPEVPLEVFEVEGGDGSGPEGFATVADLLAAGHEEVRVADADDRTHGELEGEHVDEATLADVEHWNLQGSAQGSEPTAGQAEGLKLLQVVVLPQEADTGPEGNRGERRGLWG